MVATTISLGKTVTPRGVLEGAKIVIEHGRIASIEPASLPDDALATLWAVPGFVDTHSHGGAGYDYACRSDEGVQAALDYHRYHGSTTIFASTVTEPLDVLNEQVLHLRRFVESGDLRGIHLEGPFLAEARKGAHNEALLRAPLHDYVATLIESGGGTVKMVTLAPELQHGFESIHQFIDGGVRVAFGHSDADAAVTKRSIDEGASVATHLFNAMRSIHHREPGPVPELLNDPRVLVELICDGHHVHPSVVEMSIEAAGLDRVALVTDAMSATGKPDGDYVLGTLKVNVKDGQARLVTEDGSVGALAGSTLTMDSAFEFCVDKVSMSIPDVAVIAATTPATWHELSDVGSIEVGKLADLCFVDDKGALQGVLRHGEWVREVARG